MATLLDSNAIGTILNNYADVIEGGNAYASGTIYNGIPGVGGPSEYSGASLIVDASASNSTTVFKSTSLPDVDATRLDRTGIPPMFVVCTSQAALTGNVGAGRKITAYASDTDLYTVAPAFADTIAENDAFTVLEGFRRAPDNWDIDDEDAGVPAGFDRAFSLSMLPGVQMPWYGNGVEQYKSTLEIRVRYLKRSRNRTATASVLENALRMRSILSKPSMRDGTFTQILDPEAEGPEIEFEDKTKIVTLDKYAIQYRVTSTFL